MTPECLEQRILLAAAIPTIQIDGQAPVVLPLVNGHQLLALADADSTRLFTTDGTQAGTVQFAEMPAVMSLPLNDFAILGTELYFAADGADGVELWKTDGTLAGTVLVKDISVSGDSSPAEFAVFGGEVWFAATTAASGRELWKSDGTPAGTVQVVDLVAGASSSRPGKLVEFDGQLFFAAFETDDIYRTDGTAPGTLLVIDADFSSATGHHDDATFPIAAVNGTLIVKTEGRPSTDFRELLALDSATDNTPTVLHAIASGGNSGDQKIFDGFNVVNDRLIYRYLDDVHIDHHGAHGAVWSTDGTTGGTLELLDNVFQDVQNFGPIPFYTGVFTGSGSFGETLLFYAKPQNGVTGGIFRTDGTLGGTAHLQSVTTGTQFVQAGSEAYFFKEFSSAEKQSGSAGTELWQVNSAGNALSLAAIVDPVVKFFPEATAMFDVLYFPAPHGDGTALFRFDPAATLDAGPTFTNPGPDLYYPDADLTLTWTEVTGAEHYEVSVLGREYVWYSSPPRTLQTIYSHDANNVPGTSFVLPSPMSTGHYLFSVRAVHTDGSITDWQTITRLVAPTPKNLVGLPQQPFSDLVPVAITDPNFPSQGAVEYFSTTTGLKIKDGFVNFFGDPAGQRTGDGLLSQAQRPADGLVTLRMRGDTNLNAPYSELQLDLNAGPTGLAVSYDNGNATISWDPQTSANRYDIWIDDLTSNVSQFIREPNWIGNTYTFAYASATYQVWVRSRGVQDGPATDWSQPLAFTTGGAPRLLSPATQFIDGTSPETFSWSATKDAAGYELWVNDLNTATRIIHKTDFDAQTTSYDAPIDLTPSRYAAWVRAVFPGNVFGAWSEVRAFTIQPNPVPVTGGLGTTVDATPTLTWESQAWANRYELWISVHGTTAAVYRQTTLTTNTHTVLSELPKNNYDVWVRAYGPNGLQSAWGNPYQFTIGGQPVMTSGSSAGYPVLPSRQLTWTALNDATHYDLWVDYLGGSQAAQNEIVRLTDLTTLTHTLSETLPAGNYRCWVRAVRVEAAATYFSYWSPISQFSLT